MFWCAAFDMCIYVEHLFVIAIQAQLEKRIIVREEIKALRKNVTAKW